MKSLCYNTPVSEMCTVEPVIGNDLLCQNKVVLKQSAPGNRGLPVIVYNIYFIHFLTGMSNNNAGQKG